MNILAIGAHPDDIEYGCGGFLIKAKEKKHKIFFYVLTKGEKGGPCKTREEEQKKAIEFLGIEKLFWGNFVDTNLPPLNTLIKEVEKIVKQTNPDEVYVNYFEDTHQDHRNISNAVISATRYVKNVIFYEDYTSINFEPNLFVDIEDVLDKKIKLLKFHSSQINRKYPTGLDIIESVKAIASFRGFQGKVKYAEGFKSFRFLREP